MRETGRQTEGRRTGKLTNQDAEGLVGLLPRDAAVQLRIIQLQTLQECRVTFDPCPLQDVQQGSCRSKVRESEEA